MSLRTPTERDEILRVEHLTMRFGGLVAVDESLFLRSARRHHRDHRPERRGQDDGLQLHYRLLQAHRRTHRACAWKRRGLRGAAGRHLRRKAMGHRARWRGLSPGAHAGLRDRAHGARRPHVPEHPAVCRDDGARKPARRPAQCLERCVRLHFRRPSRPRKL